MCKILIKVKTVVAKNNLCNLWLVLFIGLVTTFNCGGCGGSSSFPPVQSTPSVTTNPATDITNVSATLNGTVNPNGADVTFCYFDYGTTLSYGSQQNVGSLLGSGTSPISVTANVSSLSASTLYNFRVVATNTGGTTNGLNKTFNTAATAVDAYVWVVNYGFTYDSNNVTRILKSNPAISTTITVGTDPYGVAVDETYCWVANFSSNNVARIQKSNPAISTTITVGTGPYGVAVDETYCWVANWRSNNVTRIQKSNLSTTTIAVGTHPLGVAVDGTYCWVVNSNSKNVTRIRKSDSTWTTIAVGTSPYGVAVDETYCWVANLNSNNVTRITKSTLATTNIALETSPTGVAVDGTYCWVTNFSSNNVTRIQKSDITQKTTITVGTNPQGVAVDGTYCWVVNSNSKNVTRIRKSDSTWTTIAVVGTGFPTFVRTDSDCVRGVEGIRPYSLGDMTGYAYDNYANVPVQ
ncbi:MAG: hypothetical protein V1871_04015 [Planctomycetota bacterium]